jgi:CHAT domain-containing protein
VVGDVDFDAQPGSTAQTRTAPRGPLQSWHPLPGTRREAAAVAALFRGRFVSGRHTSLGQQTATKPAVREALGKHRYAHLATHGFFAPAQLRSALASTGGLFGQEGVTGWHPGLLSGIVLAGANRSGEEGGILTALEVAELDLAGLDLVVLSACETGLGEVAGGEGLLGLQRAFQVAGTRSTVQPVVGQRCGDQRADGGVLRPAVGREEARQAGGAAAGAAVRPGQPRRGAEAHGAVAC